MKWCFFSKKVNDLKPLNTPLIIFFFFRLHHPQTCFRTGYVQNGRTVWIGRQTGLCPEGPPKGRKWFKLEVTFFVADVFITLSWYLFDNLLLRMNRLVT